MTKTPAKESPPGSPGNPIPLPKDKQVLEKYYAGKRLESPLGGQLDILGVREGEDGTGRVLLECNGPYQPLTKSGKDWVCQQCAVSYGKA